ncbi:MAG: ATP-binding protein, partial [Deltaproteobacteria bacterium]|nr:ATP-binding protein [Deltaproteobacteria bacterium]
GLGLALVKQIVDQHQGRIEIIDRDGAGTCFRVTLPRQEELVKSSARAQPAGRLGPRTA